MNPTPKPWYKKARYLVPIGLVVLTWGVGYAADGPAPSTSTQQSVAPIEQAASTQFGSQVAVPESQTQDSSINTASNAAATSEQGTNQPTTSTQPTTVTQQAAPSSLATPPPSTQSSGLSNDNYYTNSSGNEVHSPAYAPSIPAGATAQCKDGQYSFSQHHSGTCSGHGGVAVWY